jgi:hypothetical protein
MLSMKSHELNFSIVKKYILEKKLIIEMVQSIHIQYMTKYFIKFCNYFNHFKNIFVLCSIS